MTSAEANRLVAERIFGLEVESVGGKLVYHNLQLDAERGGIWSSPVPNYLTSAEASKQLRDKLAETWESIELRYDQHGTQERQLRNSWMCRLGKFLNSRWAFVAVADTEFKAVVICALRSVGVACEGIEEPS